MHLFRCVLSPNVKELESELIREGSPKISVGIVKYNERNEREEENLKVAYVVALKSKRRQRKKKLFANDFELDVPISALKIRKQNKKKQLATEKTTVTLVEKEVESAVDAVIEKQLTIKLINNSNILLLLDGCSVLPIMAFIKAIRKRSVIEKRTINDYVLYIFRLKK
ncbi:hypothetical protein HAX54_007931, partial [Datura stramonium]|nr:hypothetical protein [Datura stramonium]